jgi:hypothetical protein
VATSAPVVGFKYILPENYELSAPVCGICHVEVSATELALTHPEMGVLFHRDCLFKDIQNHIDNKTPPTCPVCQQPLQENPSLSGRVEAFLPSRSIEEEIAEVARSSEMPPRIAALLETRSGLDCAQIKYALRCAILSGIMPNVEAVIEFAQNRYAVDLNDAWKFALVSNQFTVAAALEKMIDRKNLGIDEGC